MKPSVRVSTKAIVIEDGKLLCNKYHKHGHDYYGLPGGGQNRGEDLPTALLRECMEEISTEVKVGNLCFVRDYISQNHEFAKPDDFFHQLELMFHCELVGERKLTPGIEPDGAQIGVEWVSMEELGEKVFYPKTMIPYLQQGLDQAHPIYLGDVN
ncbi:MAG: NUDIX domain-containing protein [Bacteroidota bacterium]